MKKGIANNQTMEMPPGIYEYLLVASPDADTAARVMAEKQFFSAQFNKPIAAKTKPHITVASFLATEPMEETIMRWMHRVISAKQCFTVTLDQYGAFRPHTIYLKVQDHQPFRDLARGLRVLDQFIQGYGCPKMHLVDNAHLTIARQLDALTYRAAVQCYSQKNFAASFPVQELVLLRRKDQFDACRQLTIFRLRPM